MTDRSTISNRMFDAARTVKHRSMLARRRAARGPEALLTRVRRRDAFLTAVGSTQLPPLPRSRNSIWAIAMVRDEEDVLKATVHQLLEEGVDHVLIVDNGSTDGTADILADLGRDPQVHIGIDTWHAYEQSVKMTVLADAARRAGARWVLPFDADERWMGQNGSIAETLRTTKAPIVRADVLNLFPDPVEAGCWRLDPTPHRNSKVAFRHLPGTVVAMGNHSVLRPGRIGQGLGIVHLPWRSFAQFRRKVRQGSRAISAAAVADDAGSHWRRLGAMEDGHLAQVWVSMLQGEHVPENAWQPGKRTVPFEPSGHLTWDRVDAARLLARTEDV